ncbi:MAG: hypothetical protein AAGI52_00635 [Bacteroidota bacterium]
MVRCFSALTLVLAVTIAGCDTAPTVLDPLTVTVFVADGPNERVAFQDEVPRSAVRQVPLSIPVPPSATGVRVSSDLTSDDSVQVMTIARPERLDVYDLPRIERLAGGARDFLRGTGGAFQPLLFFSTDSLWLGSREAVRLGAQFGTRSAQMQLARGEAVVPAALAWSTEALRLDLSSGNVVEVRVEITGAREVGELVPVLLARNSSDAVLPAGTPLQGSVLLQDLGNGDRYTVPRGRGLSAFSGLQADAQQQFELFLLKL